MKQVPTPKHPPMPARNVPTKTLVAVQYQPPVIETFNGTFTQSQVELVKRTICKGATDDELSLFLAVCQRTGLDPFARQIYSIERKTWNKDKRDYDVTRSIQTGIDGFRVIAEKTNEVDGQEGPFWCGMDGKWQEVWLESNLPPVAAKVIVHRKGAKFPFVGVARFDAYAQFFKDGNEWKLTQMWNRMGDVMIAKCAEALALRKAFPQKLGELRTTDEMMQAENPERDALPEQEKLPVGATVEVFTPEKEANAKPVVADDKPAWETFVCDIGAANGPWLKKTLAEIKPKALLALAKDPRITGQKKLPEMVKAAIAARTSEMPQEAAEPPKGTDTAPKAEKPATEAPASKAKPSEDATPKEKLPEKPMAWREIEIVLPESKALHGQLLGAVANAKAGGIMPEGATGQLKEVCEGADGKAWLRTLTTQGIPKIEARGGIKDKILVNAIRAAAKEIKAFDDPEWWNACGDAYLAKEVNRRITDLALNEEENKDVLEPITKGKPLEEIGKDLLIFTLTKWSDIEAAIIQTREAK